MGLLSPSKFASREFLKQLRQDNYISWSSCGSFKEYCKEEVDELYFKKCSELANSDIEKLWKDHCERFDLGSQQGSNNMISIKGEIKMQSVSQAHRTALKMVKEFDREVQATRKLDQRFKTLTKIKRVAKKHRTELDTPVNFSLSI